MLLASGGGDPGMLSASYKAQDSPQHRMTQARMCTPLRLGSPALGRSELPGGLAEPQVSSPTLLGLVGAENLHVWLVSRCYWSLKVDR